MKTFSSYLGDEIVFAVGKNGTDYTAPVVLAKVQPGRAGCLSTKGKRQVELESVASGAASCPRSVGGDAGGRTSAAGLFEQRSDDCQPGSGGTAAGGDASAQQGSRSQFAETPFYQQIVHSYQQGAEWLFCADMEQIVAQNVQADSGNHDLPPGIGDVRYLTLEHREVGGKTESHADLMFASERQGVASWLAAPASMGSLDFVTPDASMVTSAVIKNPRTIMEEMFKMVGSGDANFSSIWPSSSQRPA